MFTPLLTWLASLLGGPFAKAAVDAYRAKLEAGNNSERIAADLAAREMAVKAERQAVDAQVVRAEQGRWFTAIVRPLFALPFIVFNLKIVVWDKVLNMGATDPLSSDMLRLEAVIVAGYFGSLAVENAARVFSRGAGR